MDAISLSQLGPIIAAILGPMLAFVVVSMRYQHLEAVKTRELISNSEREIRRDLADARERLARIEGHYGIGAVPPANEEGESNGDSNDSE